MLALKTTTMAMNTAAHMALPAPPRGERHRHHATGFENAQHAENADHAPYPADAQSVDGGNARRQIEPAPCVEIHAGDWAHGQASQ